MHRCVGVLGPCLLHPGNPDDRDMWKTYPNLWYPPENKRHIYSCRVDWNNSPPWIFCETRGSWLNLPCGSFWDYGGPAKLTCSCDRRVSWPLRVCRRRSSEVTNSKFPQILWESMIPKYHFKCNSLIRPKRWTLERNMAFPRLWATNWARKTTVSHGSTVLSFWVEEMMKRFVVASWRNMSMLRNRESAVLTIPQAWFQWSVESIYASMMIYDSGQAFIV